MTNTLVIGCLGRMGHRYQAILDYLNVAHNGVDLGTGKETFSQLVKIATHVIICTPTETHVEQIQKVLLYSNKPLSILCEKPLCVSPALTEKAFRWVEREGSKLFTVNQYNYLPEAPAFRRKDGLTRYNYFNHGRDGLHWDCFQMYALANGKVLIQESSPLWTCAINGVPIDILHMDEAYVHMVQDFLGPQENMWGKEITVRTTEKIAGLN